MASEDRWLSVEGIAVSGHFKRNRISMAGKRKNSSAPDRKALEVSAFRSGYLDQERWSG